MPGHTLSARRAVEQKSRLLQLTAPLCNYVQHTLSSSSKATSRAKSTGCPAASQNVSPSACRLLSKTLISCRLQRLGVKAVADKPQGTHNTFSQHQRNSISKSFKIQLQQNSFQETPKNWPSEIYERLHVGGRQRSAGINFCIRIVSALSLQHLCGSWSAGPREASEKFAKINQISLGLSIITKLGTRSSRRGRQSWLKNN